MTLTASDVLAPVAPSELRGLARGIPMYAKDGTVRAWTFVDPEDFEWATQYRWSYSDGYAKRFTSRGGIRRSYLMHREILGLEHGDSRQGEHENRDRADNRRCNLRIVDGQAENNQNPSPRTGAVSQYRGVGFDRRYGWRAYARVDGCFHHLGYFDSEERAAEVAAAFRAEHMPFAND